MLLRKEWNHFFQIFKFRIRRIMWLVDALVKIYYLLLNYQGLKLLIDFEKAFDTLEKKFFIKHCLNFGNKFRKCVFTWYSNISSLVIYNSFSSFQFKVERGVRQGCPLSHVLSILNMELLVNNFRTLR